ncbi:MAG: hypothetical protein M0R80_01005 [Proteobacteria bacterium]|jgi:hypothetical protein|nr:hypothetical protein [Pseudomonadota bacterium]
MKFEIDDRVVVKYPSRFPNNLVWLGQQGVVIGVALPLVFVRIEDSHNKFWSLGFRENELELVSVEKEIDYFMEAFV